MSTETAKSRRLWNDWRNDLIVTPCRQGHEFHGQVAQVVEVWTSGKDGIDAADGVLALRFRDGLEVFSAASEWMTATVNQIEEFQNVDVN